MSWVPLNLRVSHSNPKERGELVLERMLVVRWGQVEWPLALLPTIFPSLPLRDRLASPADTSRAHSGPLLMAIFIPLCDLPSFSMSGCIQILLCIPLPLAWLVFN